jgi:hypothetical protein
METGMMRTIKVVCRRILAALHQSRRIQGALEIARYRHLTHHPEVQAWMSRDLVAEARRQRRGHVRDQLVEQIIRRKRA